MVENIIATVAIDIKKTCVHILLTWTPIYLLFMERNLVIYSNSLKDIIMKLF